MQVHFYVTACLEARTRACLPYMQGRVPNGLRVTALPGREHMYICTYERDSYRNVADSFRIQVAHARPCTLQCVCMRCHAMP